MVVNGCGRHRGSVHMQDLLARQTNIFADLHGLILHTSMLRGLAMDTQAMKDADVEEPRVQPVAPQTLFCHHLSSQYQLLVCKVI